MTISPEFGARPSGGPRRSPLGVMSAILPAPTSPLRRLLRFAMSISPLVTLAALGLPICPIAIVFRVPCPGCGVTRSTYHLVTGDFHQALHYQPLAFFIGPAIIGLTVYHLGYYVFTGNSRWPWKNSLIIVMGVCLLVVYAARMFGMFGGPVDV